MSAFNEFTILAQIADYERENPLFKEVVKTCNHSDDFQFIINGECKSESEV